VASGLGLYLLYLVREPLGWCLLAAFIAICVASPIAALSRHMKRGFAITIVYLSIIFAPFVLAAILIPPVVRQLVSLVNSLPEHIADLQDTLAKNGKTDALNDNFDVTGKLDELAHNAAKSLGQAAGALVDVGSGIVGSIFSLVTILVLSLFLIGRGNGWREAFLATRPPRQADSLRRAMNRMVDAVGAYIHGALLQAFVAGASAFTMLVILGVPSPLALATIIMVLDLIPLVGATLGAVVVGVVTAFDDFPTDTIIWTIFAIAYQQFENYVVQPRIQGHAVQLDPFLVVVAALFGAALLGVLGAILAIPCAAAIQIGVREWLAYRREEAGVEGAAIAPTSPSSPSADR
jgi:predicted PurR-regulated permease PerM